LVEVGSEKGWALVERFRQLVPPAPEEAIAEKRSESGKLWLTSTGSAPTGFKLWLLQGCFQKVGLNTLSGRK
jgi:hypothetical protein